MRGDRRAAPLDHRIAAFLFAAVAAFVLAVALPRCRCSTSRDACTAGRRRRFVRLLAASVLPWLPQSSCWAAVFARLTLLLPGGAARRAAPAPRLGESSSGLTSPSAFSTSDSWPWHAARRPRRCGGKQRQVVGEPRHRARLLALLERGQHLLGARHDGGRQAGELARHGCRRSGRRRPAPPRAGTRPRSAIP